MQTLTRSLSLRHMDGEGGQPMLTGYAIRWNEWIRVDSRDEGTFMERFAPGAFDRSIAQNFSHIRVLFQHGRDPYVGQKPLGSLEHLQDNGTGLHYHVRLLDAGYVNELVPGIRAGQYGASVAFNVQRQALVRSPGRSDWNLDGIPERTVQEANLYEFSVVTFPAYKGSSAALRGMYPRWYLGHPVATPQRYLPVAVSRSQSWRLPGTEPWRLSRRRDKPGWSLNR